MKTCNNKSNCHSPVIIEDTDDAIRVMCATCKEQAILRRDWRGVPENRAYSKFFRKDILQGNDSLFYKYHPQHILV